MLNFDPKVLPKHYLRSPRQNSAGILSSLKSMHHQRQMSALHTVAEIYSEICYHGSKCLRTTSPDIRTMTAKVTLHSPSYCPCIFHSTCYLNQNCNVSTASRFVLNVHSFLVLTVPLLL